MQWQIDVMERLFWELGDLRQLNPMKVVDVVRSIFVLDQMLITGEPDEIIQSHYEAVRNQINHCRAHARNPSRRRRFKRR